NELIEENESILKQAQEISGTGSFVISFADDGTPLLKGSDAMNALYELPPGMRPTMEQILGPVIPEHKSRITDSMEASLKGKTTHIEFTARFMSGSRRHFKSTIFPVTEEGKVVRLLGATTDITEMREAENSIWVVFPFKEA